ncbi:hypothetical protein JTB14_016061 [Gonioctena quinquepunctata]|nr:hypothetical protein JTB14_016061 [Gonioctena quinquepunctata]
MEAEDSVIHVDHAYASQNIIEEDPLKLPEPEVVIKTEIKTEYVEIKVEELDTFEMETNQISNLESYNDSFYDPDNFQDRAEIEILNHTTFETDLMNSQHVEIQEECKEVTSAASNAIQLAKENKALKRSIARLKREKVRCDLSIQANSKKFYDDLNKMHKIQCDLQTEIGNLREENKKYQNQLICYDKMKKNHLDLETNILELRRQATRFMEFEKIAIYNTRKVMDAKENENRIVKKRLATSTKRLTDLKAKINNLMKVNRCRMVRASEINELQEKLKTAVRMNKIYDVHLKTSKAKFVEELNKKQDELNVAQAEIETLRKTNKDKESSNNILKEKYKLLLKNQEKKGKKEIGKTTCIEDDYFIITEEGRK